jgi:hypothetical protein
MIELRAKQPLSRANAVVPNAIVAAVCIAILSDSTPVRLDELENRLRNLVELCAASAQFVGNVHGCISGPSFSGIEGNDANRFFVLARQQVEDQRLAISGISLCFAPGVPDTAAKVIQHEVPIGAAAVQGLHAQGAKLKAYAIAEFEPLDTSAKPRSCLPPARRSKQPTVTVCAPRPDEWFR